MSAEIHEQEYGLSDIIQHLALVEDGVVALKDGGIQAGWRYMGRDYASLTDSAALESRDSLGGVINLGKGWVFETNVVRSPCRDYEVWGKFPNTTATLIEAERRTTYTAPNTYYKSDCYATLTYFPPNRAEENAKGFFYDSPGGKNYALEALNTFKAGMADFESTCSRFLCLERLKAKAYKDEQGTEWQCDELLRYLSLCINGDDRPVLLPDEDADLDWLLPKAGMTGGTRPLLGKKHLRVLKIGSFPPKIFPLAISALESLPMAYRFHGRSIMLDQSEAIALHEANRKRHGSKVISFMAKLAKAVNAPVNSRALALAQDAAEAKALCEDPNECTGLFSGRLIILRDTAEEADRDLRVLDSCLEAMHMRGLDEDYNVLDAWAGSLPGHAFFDIRQVPLRGFNIAGLTPVHSVWRGEEYHPSPKMPAKSSPLLIGTAPGMTPTRITLHDSDVGHVAMFGPTGNGKSTVLGALAVSELRYEGAHVFMFDRMRTQYVLTKAVGGLYYDFVNDPTITTCPLQDLETASDLSWAAKYIEILCRENGLTVNAGHRDAIGTGLERLRGGRHRSLTHFQAAVQHEDIVEALQLYTIGNPVSAKILDGESDSIKSSHWTAFEMKELMSMHRSIGIAMWLHLIRRIEKTIDPRFPTRIFMDEARRLVHDDMTAMAIEDWLKELRNLNGSCLLALQELEDTMGHPKLRSVIEQQCKTKIFLPNPEALNTAKVNQHYREAGLNEAQIYQVAKAEPKRDYCISRAGHFQTVSFDFKPVTLAFIAANLDHDREDVDRLIRRNPETWQADWLRVKGLHDWADHYEELENERKGRSLYATA